MPVSSTIYKVLVASPGDVTAERTVLGEVIDDWNSANSRAYGITLQPLRWELDGVPASGDRPQELLNRQFVKSGDILLGVFWVRLGTPTGKAPSGTVEEIEHFRDQGKPVLLYFSEANIPHGHDPEQFRLLQEYRATLKVDTLYSTFRGPEDLRRRATRDLANTINSIVAPSPRPTLEIPPVASNDFARVNLRAGNRSFIGVNVLTIFGEIQNTSSNRRIHEYSCTLTVPKCCLSFSAAAQAAEVPCDEPDYRRFRYSEKNHSNVQLFPGDTYQVVSTDIAVGHLSPGVRSECLYNVIKADAVVDGERLHVAKRVGEFIGQ